MLGPLVRQRQKFSALVLRIVLAGLISAVHPIPASADYVGVNLAPPSATASTAFQSENGMQVGYATIGGVDLPVTWSGSLSSFAPLASGPFTTGRAVAISNGMIGGFGWKPSLGMDPVTGEPNNHAAFWSNSSSTAIDLNPSGYQMSNIAGAGGGAMVGFGRLPTDGYLSYGLGYTRPLLWTSPGSVLSPVDLTPAGFLDGRALGTDGARQVGYADTLTEFAHAIWWSGTAASAIDLHPGPDFTDTVAYAVDGIRQVGAGITPDGFEHPLLWFGSASSVVDLLPSDFVFGRVTGVFGGYEVGVGVDSSFNRHALLWHDTAASVVDLNPYLPAGLIEATAFTIDAQGNIVGRGFDVENQRDALLLRNVPEPASALLFLTGMGGLVIGRAGTGRSCARRGRWRVRMMSAALP